jgi:Flp pilus assembly protein TadD
LAISKKAVLLDNTSAEAYKALGLSYGMSGFIDSNMESYTKALKLNPNLFSAMTNLAGTHSELGELCKGLQLLKKAAVIAPTQPTSHAGMGDIYRLIGESKRAEREFKIALDLQFDNNDVYVIVTDYYLINNRGREAKDLMSKLVTLNFDNSVILERAGYVAAITGDLTTAKEYYQRSLSIRATSETINDSSGGIMFGYILMKEGKRNQAERILEKEKIFRNNYLKSGGRGPGAEYNLARIYAIQGNKQEAFTHLERAIDKGKVDYQWTLIEPQFENIRNNEEFKKLIAQMKAKVDEQRKLIEQMEKEESHNKLDQIE